MAQLSRAGSGQPGTLDAVAQPAAEAEGGTDAEEGQGAGDASCLRVTIVETI